MPEAIATTVIEFVVDHVRDKLLRGLDQHPILRLRKQGEAEQCDYERCAWMHTIAPKETYCPNPHIGHIGAHRPYLYALE